MCVRSNLKYTETICWSQWKLLSAPLAHLLEIFSLRALPRSDMNIMKTQRKYF